MRFIKNGYSIHVLRGDYTTGEIWFGLFFEDKLILEDTNEGFLKLRMNELKNKK